VIAFIPFDVWTPLIRESLEQDRLDLSVYEGSPAMGADDKMQNKAEELKGKAKEAAGNATDNEQWQAEGKADQAKGSLKQAGEKVKDAAKGIVNK
jgi:uncharacterized protein YjbJ (UPF0337 family)